ncbi:MAG: hypothetical protein SGARI_003754 [Bacillariaceae sp.]
MADKDDDKHLTEDDAGSKGKEGESLSDGEDDFELDPEKRREARKMRRVMANRRSARESRECRKKLLSDLQESVEGLTSENTTLTKENMSLRRELASLIEQSGGAASLSMIPNIQSLLNSTKNLSNLTVPPSAAMTGGDLKRESSK